VRFFLFLLAATLAIAQSKSGGKAAGAPILKHEVVRSYPHDRGAFTQGMFYLDGQLWEGTGLEGRSSIRRVELTTGKVLQMELQGSQYFGEGLAALGNELFQLTWKNGLMFVYDKATFKLTKAIRYTGEGWGLTTDGQVLIKSDGSSALHFIDPKDGHEVRTLRVTDGGREIAALNELEYIKGEIWANVWQSNRIARIDPKTGRVTSWLSFTGILNAQEAAGTDVLNGIAYDSATGRIFITGKLWPKLFEIRVAGGKR
jgi:glutaminyl-peptide cyclotransferase